MTLVSMAILQHTRWLLPPAKEMPAGVGFGCHYTLARLSIVHRCVAFSLSRDLRGDLGLSFSNRMDRLLSS